MTSYKQVIFLFSLSLLNFPLYVLSVEDNKTYKLIKESSLSGEIITINNNDLKKIGIQIVSQDAGGGQSVIQIKLSDKMMNLIKKEELELRFSFLDSNKNLLTSMHQYLGGPTDFFVSQGKIFRIALTVNCDFKILNKNIVYIFDYIT